MRLLGLALLLFTTGSIKCGNYEDAKDLISSFKSVVDVPLSKDFKKAHLFLSLSKSFLKRTVPFAELFATALTVGLEEDQMGALLNLTNGIDKKVGDIAQQQKYLQTSTVYRDLVLEYDDKVDEKIRNLLGQLEFMSSLRMKVKQSVIDTFVHECNGINSPRVVAEYMALLVRRCAEPVLSTTVLTQLFDLIHNIKFMDYSLTSDEQHLFAERFATVYFHLSSRHEKFSLLAKFADSRKNIFVQNKLVLFGHLIEELGISLLDGLDTFCLPKAAFVLHVQKRDSIERFADNLMQHISSLEYVTVMCANITFYGEPEQADKFTLKVEGILEPVHAFISTWFPAILESTWPTTESLMIRNIMKEESQGVIFAETNQTYKQILNVVHDKMRMVGHPYYRRQYVATRERSTTSLSTDFHFRCKNNCCTNSSTMDAHTISIRTRTDTNQAYESLRRLLEFRNTSYPIFWSAMDKELYKYSFVKQAVQTLARKYGLDFNQFTNHSSYVVLRQDN